MEWGLLAVLLASFVYIGLMIFKYTGFMGEIGPLIKQLRERSENLQEAIAKERKLTGVIQNQVEEEERILTGLKLALSDTQQGLQAATALKEKLEWEMYKRGKQIEE